MEGASMKRLEQEIYGFGQRLSTRPDVGVIAARIVIVSAIAAGVLAVMLAGAAWT